MKTQEFRKKIRPVRVLFSESLVKVTPKAPEAWYSTGKMFEIDKRNTRVKRSVVCPPPERDNSRHLKVFKITKSVHRCSVTNLDNLNFLCRELNKEIAEEAKPVGNSYHKIFEISRLSKLQRQEELYSPGLETAEHVTQNCTPIQEISHQDLGSNAIVSNTEDEEDLGREKDFEKVFKITRKLTNQDLQTESESSSSPKPPVYRKMFTVRKVQRNRRRRKLTFGGSSSAFSKFTVPSAESSKSEGDNFYSFLSSKLLKYGKVLDLEGCKSLEDLKETNLESFLNLSLAFKLVPQSPLADTEFKKLGDVKISMPIAKYK